MRRIVKSPQAVADLEALWLEGVQRHGRKQAEKFIRSIHARFELLAADPNPGVAPLEIGPGLRMHFLPALLVITYRFTTDELRILRIFHGRRRCEKLLRE